MDTRLAGMALAAIMAAAGMAHGQQGQQGADGAGSGLLRMEVGYSDEIFDRQEHVPDKLARMFFARRDGRLQQGGLYLGGRLLATHIWEHTNTPGKFPILSRFPPTHTSGSTDDYGVINEISLAATLVLPLVTAFAQGEYSELRFPGQDDVMLRKYWVTFGDPDLAPVYLGIGRKTINFGNFATYAPFTHSHSNHYFSAQSEDPVVELGLVNDSTELAFTLIPEHRGLRVLSSPGNDGAWDNFAINAAHRFDLGQGRSLRLGGGFLRGTIYDSAIAHHPPDTGSNRFWNGAWDVNATLSTARLDLMAEFTRTRKAWPATGHHVEAVTLQGRWRGRMLKRPAIWSLSLSRGVQGARGTRWERMEQAILGVELALSEHLRLGAEYMLNRGFVPLIMPRITGDRNVRSQTFILGGEFTF